MLASARQATISHLWPVRPPVAAAFVCWLPTLLPAVAAISIHLRTHFSACTHLRLTCATPCVNNSRPELVQRLENADLEMDNIFSWGSTAFLQ